MSDPSTLGHIYIGDSPPMPVSRATLTYEISDPLRDAVRHHVRLTVEWLDAARHLLDRRRYNRARRKAVRAVLSGLAALPATRSPAEP